MKKSTRMNAERRDEAAAKTIGIDLGDRMSQYVGLDDHGEVVTEGRVPTTVAAFEKLFGAMEPKLIAIETGTHSPWVSRLLKKLGHQVVVANSRKLRLVYENSHKSDRVDAEYLARLVRVDPKLLKPVNHRNERAQHHVMILRGRDVLVRSRARLITNVRGSVKSVGLRVPACSVEAFVKRAAAVIPATLKEAVGPVLAMIDQLNKQIALCDKKIERLAKDEYPEAEWLMQIRGVGALTAVAYIVTIGDHKFARSRTVGAWLGLTPGQRASGQADPQQRITKEGDSYLRSLLINCAHYILGPFGEDCDLRRHGMAIAARGGKNAKKRAVVAVARKLAVLLHKLWVSKAKYERLRKQAVASRAA